MCVSDVRYGRETPLAHRNPPRGGGGTLVCVYSGASTGRRLYPAKNKGEKCSKLQLKLITTIAPVFKLLYFWGISACYMKRKTVDPGSFDSQVMLIMGAHVKCIRCILVRGTIAHNYSVYPHSERIHKDPFTSQPNYL